MKRIISILVILVVVSAAFANDRVVFRNSELMESSVFADQSDKNKEKETMPGGKRVAPKKQAYKDGKSPLIASGLSLLIPGAGEIYGEEYLRAGIFLGIEATMLGLYSYYEGEGDDKTNEFHKFADTEFSRSRYYQGVAYFLNGNSLDGDMFSTWVDSASNSANWNSDISNNISAQLDSLLEGNRNTEFTHQLPDKKTQQYYEMIGKYHQFSIGWSDFNGWSEIDGDNVISAQNGFSLNNFNGNSEDWDSDIRKNHYEELRDEANQLYETGQNFLMLTLINHVASTFDAGFIIKSKYKIDTALRLNRKHKDEMFGMDNYSLSYTVSF